MENKVVIQSLHVHILTSFSSGHQDPLSICVYLPLHYSAEQEQRVFLVSLGHMSQAMSAAAVCKGRQSKFICLWIFNITKALALHWPMHAPSEAGTDLAWVTSVWFYCILINGKGKWGEGKRGFPLMTWSQLPYLGGREQISMKIKDKVMGKRPRDLFWSHGLAYVSPSLSPGGGRTGRLETHEILLLPSYFKYPVQFSNLFRCLVPPHEN